MSVEKVIVVEANPEIRAQLETLLHGAGFEVSSYQSTHEALDAIHTDGCDLLLLDTDLPSETSPSVHETVSTLRDSTVSERIRIILLVGPSLEHRVAALDLGANDALSRPWDDGELLARIRARMRTRRGEKELEERMRIAEEGQQIAHTAFEALAVTEKMSSDAATLNTGLKRGIIAVFVVALFMAATYFLFARNEQKQTQQTDKIIIGLEGRLLHQADLMAQASKLRDQRLASEGLGSRAQELEKQSADLKAKIATQSSTADPTAVAELQKQLQETDERLQKVEQEGEAAQSIIPADVQSVCLLHVTVAFRNQQSGLRLRYAGISSQGEPLKGSDGNTLFALTGNGPEVKMDVFGTGFVAGPGGRVITNRHVAEPWWKNDDIKALTDQGFQAEISSIRAYFPGDGRSFSTEIQDISKDTDLATMHVDMQDLKRPILAIDPSNGAAVSGEPIVLMGYATGLAGILARTDEDTAREILTHSGGDISAVMADLAQRKLIRPIITQGHIGDVLPDKIVFDAQTTSGGSGGPLLNRKGKVIGVTYAVLDGFGGSNFGIPIRLSESLLTDKSSNGAN